jgi:hypothetical protein
VPAAAAAAVRVVPVVPVPAGLQPVVPAALVPEGAAQQPLVTVGTVAMAEV